MGDIAQGLGALPHASEAATPISPNESPLLGKELQAPCFVSPLFSSPLTLLLRKQKQHAPGRGETEASNGADTGGHVFQVPPTHAPRHGQGAAARFLE